MRRNAPRLHPTAGMHRFFPSALAICAPIAAVGSRDRWADRGGVFPRVHRHAMPIGDSDMTVQHQSVDECSCHDDDHHHQRRFCVNTEGTEHPWDHDTITMEEIAKLGGWDAGQGVIEVLADNTERTLKPGEVVHLRPGREFCRRVRWKRGFLRTDRLASELTLLRQAYPDAEHRDGWFRIPAFSLSRGWNRSTTELVFQAPDGYPATPPYGIYVPAGLLFNGNMPNNYNQQPSNKPPFSGTWGILSWQVFDAGDWRPGSTVEHGATLLAWVRGCALRFAEGV